MGKCGQLKTKLINVDFDKVLGFKTAKVVVVEDKYVGGVSFIGYLAVFIYMLYIMFVSKVYVTCVHPGSHVTSISGHFLGTRFSVLSNAECDTLGISRSGNDSDFLMHSYHSSKTSACTSNSIDACTTLLDDCMWYTDAKLCFESDEELAMELFVEKGSLSEATVEAALRAFLMEELRFPTEEINVTVMTKSEYLVSGFEFDPDNVVTMQDTQYAVYLVAKTPVKGLDPELIQYKVARTQELVDDLQQHTNVTVAWFGRLKFAYDPSIVGIDIQEIVLDYEGFSTEQDGTNTTRRRLGGRRRLSEDGEHSPFGAPPDGGFGKGNSERLINKHHFTDQNGFASIVHINAVSPADTVYTIMENSQIDAVRLRLGETLSVSYNQDSKYIFNLFTSMDDYYMEFDLSIVNALYTDAADADKPYFGGSIENTHLRLLDQQGNVVDDCTRYGIDITQTSAPATCALQTVPCSSALDSDLMSIPLGSFLRAAGIRLGMPLSELGTDAVDDCIETVQKLYGFNDQTSYDQLRALGFLDILDDRTELGGGFDEVLEKTTLFCQKVSWELLGGSLTVSVDVNNMPQTDTYAFSQGLSGGPYREEFINVDMTASFSMGEGRFPGIDVLFVHNGNICQFTFQALLVQVTAAVTLFASAALLTELCLRIRQRDVYEKKFQRERIERGVVHPDTEALRTDIKEVTKMAEKANRRADKAEEDIAGIKRLMTSQRESQLLLLPALSRSP